MKLTPFISLLLIGATPVVAKEAAPPFQITLPTVKPREGTDFAQLEELMRRYQAEPTLKLDSHIGLKRIKPPRRYDPGHFYRDPAGYGPVLTLRF